MSTHVIAAAERVADQLVERRSGDALRDLAVAVGSREDLTRWLQNAGVRWLLAGHADQGPLITTQAARELTVEDWPPTRNLFFFSVLESLGCQHWAPANPDAEAAKMPAFNRRMGRIAA